MWWRMYTVCAAAACGRFESRCEMLPSACEMLPSSCEMLPSLFASSAAAARLCACRCDCGCMGAAPCVHYLAVGD